MKQRAPAIMDDNQHRLRQFGVLDTDQSTLYEYDNPMHDRPDDTDDTETDSLNINCDDFWTFDQFESQADAHDAAAEHVDALAGDAE